VIEGTVNGRCHVTVPLRLRGPGGLVVAKDAVVDTLFDRALFIPKALAVFLQMPRRGRRPLILGHNVEVLFETYEATLEWNGTERQAIAYAIPGGDPIIGLELLRRHTLVFTLVPNAPVYLYPPDEEPEILL
jgi:predicted aspartyl protease